MNIVKKHLLAKPEFVVPIILVSAHSLFALYTFLTVCASRDAQAGFAWFTFFNIDYPSAQLAFTWLSPTPPVRALFDRGYDLVGSGPNLRAFVLIIFAGCVQWLVIGYVLGKGISWIRAHVRLRQA